MAADGETALADTIIEIRVGILPFDVKDAVSRPFDILGPPDTPATGPGSDDEGKGGFEPLDELTTGIGKLVAAGDRTALADAEIEPGVDNAGLNLGDAVPPPLSIPNEPKVLIDRLEIGEKG